MVKQKTNEITYMHFTVFDTDGTTPLTGQVGSCTEDLRKNGATTAEVVTLAEIGASGYYYASFTPLATSNYDLEVTCPDGRVVGESYETEVADLDDIKADSAAILLDTDTLEADLNTYLDAIETNVISEIDTNESKIDALQGDVSSILDDTDTIEADLKTHIDAAETALTVEINANETKIDAVKVDTAAILIDTDTMEADLTTEIDANETKLDAITTHLTDIKGVGWVDENIKTIDANVDAILVDTDTLEADLYTYIDNMETLVISEIDDNQLDIADVQAVVDAIVIDTDTIEADLKAYMDTIEDNIRGLDDDDLKDISDEIALIPATNAAAVADAVWDEDKLGHTGDLKTMADNLDQAISTTETSLTVEIDANETKIDAIKVDTAAILLDTDDMEADLTTQINANETKIDVNTGHLTDIKGVGWTNENLKTIDENIDDIESDVDQSLSTTQTAIIAEIDANETKIDAVKVDTAAILIDTDDMEVNLTTEINANETKIDTMQGNVTDILADTVAILEDTGTTIPTAITTTETNIRGADSDDLKDISDEIAALPTDASIADQVWDETLLDHIAAGSIGQILYLLEASHINKFVWDDGNSRFELYNSADALIGYLVINTTDNVYQRTGRFTLL